MRSPTSTTAFRYDHLGPLQYETKTLGSRIGFGLLIRYRRQRHSMTYPSGRIVTYTYDLAGRQLSAASGVTTFASSATYLPFGPLTGFTFGNGLTKAMSYDSRYRLIDNQPYGNVYLMRKGSRADQPLRFPGQEAAMTWEGAEENYNVFRWYRAGWGRYTQADRWFVQQPPYAYAWDNPIDGFDKTGQVTIRTGPAVVHKVDISTVYHECNVSMGGGLKGCMDDHLKFFCDCHCVTSLGFFRKDIALISPSFDIWAATNAVADNGPYLVSADLIASEELNT